MESTGGRAVHPTVQRLHRLSWLLLRLCWGKLCHRDHVYSHHLVRESARQPKRYSRCLGNRSYFVSKEFTECAKQWEYQRVILSPYRPKYKERAQSAVKVVKSLFEKALKDNKDRGRFCWTREIRPRQPYSQALSSGWCQEEKKSFSLRFLYHKVPQGVSDRSHKKCQKPKAIMTVMLEQRGQS